MFKKLLLFLSVLLLFFTLLTPAKAMEVVINPDTNQPPAGVVTTPTDDKADEKKKEAARQDLDNYTSYMYVDDKGLITPSISASLQMIFVRSQFFVTKLIYQFVNFVNQALNNNTVISDWRTSVFKTAQNIYGQFLKPDLLPVTSIGILVTLLYYFFKKRLMEGIRKLLLVIVLSTGFIYGGNDLVSKVQDAMSAVSTTVVKTISIAGVSGTDKNDLFTTMVKIPFLHLNFDDVTLNKDGTSNIKQDDIDRLLMSNDDNDELKTIQGDLKDKHLTNKKLGDKIVTAFASIINALLLGTVYLFFAVFSFGMDFFFIILVFILPFAAVASFFPSFSQTIFKWGKTSVGVLLLSGIGVFGTAFVGLFDGLVSMVLSSLLGSNYFFVTLVKIIVYGVVWWKRQLILKIFAATSMGNGKLSNRIDGLLSNARQRTVEAVKNPVLSGVAGGLTMGMTLGAMGKDKINDIRTAGTGSLKHGKDLRRYNQTLKKLDQYDYDSDKAKKLREREAKLQKRINHNKEKLDLPDGKLSRFRQAYQKRRLGADHPFFEEQKNKKEQQRKSINDGYKRMSNKRQDYLKKKQNDAIEHRFRKKIPEELPNLDKLAKQKYETSKEINQIPEQFRTNLVKRNDRISEEIKHAAERTKQNFEQKRLEKEREAKHEQEKRQQLNARNRGIKVPQPSNAPNKLAAKALERQFGGGNSSLRK